MTGMAQSRPPRYGQVWIADLEPVVGAEIGKQRPVLVISNDLNNRFAATVTVLPITSALARRIYPDEVVVPRGAAGLTRSANRIKANMIRTVDKSRLVRLLGDLPIEYHAEVRRALGVHLNLVP